MVACMKGHVIMTRLLLEKGADRTLRTPAGSDLLNEISHMPYLREETKAELCTLLARAPGRK